MSNLSGSPKATAGAGAAASTELAPTLITARTSAGPEVVEKDGTEQSGSHRSDERSEGGSSVSNTSSTSNRRYVLTVVQQPTGSAEFGSNVLSRLPLSPPLIVQLQCTDLEGKPVNIDHNLPFLFSHLTLLPSSETPAGTSSSNGSAAPSTTQHAADAVDVVIDSASPNPQPMRMLYGTLVSSPHELALRTDESDEPQRGIYFVFPDVSVRTRGTYRLGVGLMRIAAPPGDPANPPTHETLAFISTGDFVITPLAEYVAPGPTPLTADLADQGVQMFLGRHR